MYAVAESAEGDCYLSVPPNPGIEAAALGASASAASGTGESTAPGAGESAVSGTAPTEALHTFTLDSGASRSLFRDSTTLTPLNRPVAVSLADPSGGPVLAHSSTVLPCPAAPSGLLSGLHLPSFSTNLVSGADLQDAWVDQFTPSGQRVTHCTCSRTGRHLATFTRRPGSSLYTLTTASPQVAVSGQVFSATSRSSPESSPCSCCPLSHETLLWHHRLGPAPTCVPCVEGWQRAAPHSSEFPPTEAPLQTLHMDVWGPARVCGQGHKRYFLLVVDDYSRYTTVFPLRSKDRGGEFSSDLLRAFCRAEGIRQTSTLPASPQQNGIAERRIGMVMDVARTSMIHAAARHFLGPPPPLLSPPPERRGPESRLASPESRSESPDCAVRTGCRVPRQRPPLVPGTHSMIPRPSTAPQRFPLPSPPASSLPNGPDPESDSLHAARPTVSRFLATAITDPLFESTTAFALVAELVDFVAACCLDYATSLVAESATASLYPPSVRGECALSTDVLEDRQEEFECFAAAVPHLVSMLLAPEGDPDAPDIPAPRSYAEAIEGPYSSQWQAAMDAEMASWKSTGTYVDDVPPLGVNIVSGMWIFRVNRPPGSPPVFKARYVARGFSQRQGVDFFQTFSPTPKMTTLRVLLHVAAQRDYELHSLAFSTAFLQGSLHEEIWLRRPPGFTGSFPDGTQWSLRRQVYGLRQAPREWHDTLRTTLAALGFAPSTADPSLFLRTDTTLPPFYVLVYVDDLVFATADTEALAHVKAELQKRHTCTDLAPPSDESVEPSGPYPELVGCVMYLMTCTRPDLAYPLSLVARYVAPVFQAWGSCLEDGLELSSLVTQLLPSSNCEAEIYAGAMAAQELRLLTYLLTDLREAPRSPPVLYVDNKAMLALCQEHRLEHRTKHIALRYFLARELQQRG
ncbi:unnamed protein product [Closterium sp. NIES-53]